MNSTFYDELCDLINKYSLEGKSNTPDFILAQYLEDCLDTFDTAIQNRALWYGRMDSPGTEWELKND